jgi:hypothetical protein
VQRIAGDLMATRTRYAARRGRQPPAWRPAHLSRARSAPASASGPDGLAEQMGIVGRSLQAVSLETLLMGPMGSRSGGAEWPVRTWRT